MNRVHKTTNITQAVSLLLSAWKSRNVRHIELSRSGCMRVWFDGTKASNIGWRRPWYTRYLDYSLSCESCLGKYSDAWTSVCRTIALSLNCTGAVLSVTIRLLLGCWFNFRNRYRIGLPACRGMIDGLRHLQRCIIRYAPANIASSMFSEDRYR